MSALNETDFLDPETRRPWSAKLPGGLEPAGYHLGQGQNGLEVAIVRAGSRPKTEPIRKAFKERQGNRPSPVLLVALYAENGDERADLCGPLGPDPAIVSGLEAGQAERIAAAALEEPDRHAAIRFLQASLPEAEEDMPGLRNVGMFATHHLRAGVPTRPDWNKATAEGREILSHRGRALVEALGFTVEAHGTSTSVLRAKGVARGVAVFLDETETFEAGAERFGSSSPVSYALAVADAEDLPYAVLTRGRQIRVRYR